MSATVRFGPQRRPRPATERPPKRAQHLEIGRSSTAPDGNSLTRPLTVDGVHNKANVRFRRLAGIGMAQSWLFEVTQPRVTCYRVGIRMDEPRMAALLVEHHRPGFYFRVLEVGDVAAGDEIVKVSEIVTDLLGYCWACACTWAAADSGSSQKHAIIRECEHNLTFMSPARDQFARTTRVSARARCLSLWPKRLPAEAEESALTSHSSPTNDPPIGLHWQRP